MIDTRAALLLFALAWLSGYALACRFWPYAACRRCGGNGKSRPPGPLGALLGGRGSWRTCPRCKGSGDRLRLGTRAWRTYRDHLTRGRP